MNTWAIIRSGYACEVVTGATVDAALAGKFTPSWIAANSASYIQVPNGTQSGAKDNGDGTFTNPSPISTPLTLTKKACRLRVINALMVANSATNSASRARMQDLRLQVNSLTVTTDAHRRAKGALEAWREDEYFTKVEFQTITNDIDGGTNMTDNERDAILGTLVGSAPWPEA